MEQKFFLESKRNKFSNDVERAVDLALSTKTRLLPNDDALDEFSLFEQYNKERDECRKYRIILNMNPICSNVLFNARTEVVINEGSSACTALIGKNSVSKSKYAPNAINAKENIDYFHAIRNTEYSHKENGGFVYHCGFDIFNNHMLRKTDFIHVNKLNTNSSQKEKEVYNTIMDYCRDSNGDIVQEDLNVKFNSKKGLSKLHLYQYDTIMSMPVAFMDNCIEKDGWWGFTNPNTIEINNNSGNSITINRMMANNKSCEFIDLYPDRSLFSFIPKFNKFRRRSEKNWDYCLTYPFKKDFNKINEICGGEEQAIRANVRYTFNGNGMPLVEVSSYFKHNLSPGEYVTFYYYEPTYSNSRYTEDYPEDSELTMIKENGVEKLYETINIDENGEIKIDESTNSKATPVNTVESKEFRKYSVKVKVVSVGDVSGYLTDRIFKVNFEDIELIFDKMRFFGCFYKKNNGDSECLYYFRKFKKLKTIEGLDLKSDINKVAFGRNIYGDEIAQILFLDDLDISNLNDHNGRPVSEIYFTVIKRNAGRKEWYEKKNYSGETVEYSHCFGEVSSGVDFCGIDNEPFDYNVHYLHNITKPTTLTSSISNTFSAWGDTIIIGKPKVIESGITIESYDEFYGDIVEYDTKIAKETIIGNVYHRFNTEQREIFNTDFRDIKQDSIISDDYDYANGVGKEFSCTTYYVNNVKNPLDDKGIVANLMYGNILPEGYFYNPHTKIQLRENDEVETYSDVKNINYSSLSVLEKTTYLLLKNNGESEKYDNIVDANINKEENDVIVKDRTYYEFKLNAPINYGFYKGDYIAFYDKITGDSVWGEIVNVENGINLTVNIDGDDFTMVDYVLESYFSPYSGTRRFYAYWSSNNVPLYAKFCVGTKRFVWRKLIEPSKIMRDGETYNTPFTNGCFYVEKNINFFLKRQDPTGKYGLSKPLHRIYKGGVSNPLNRFSLGGNDPIDFSDVMYTLNNLDNDCANGTY